MPLFSAPVHMWGLLELESSCNLGPVTGKRRPTSQRLNSETIYGAIRFHSTALPCGRLVGLVRYAVRHVVENMTQSGLQEPNMRHIPQLWALAAVRTTSLVTGLKNYHNLGDAQMVLMENPGTIALPE